MSNELRLARYWFALAYMMLLVFGILSLIPGPDIGDSDKIAHFVSYAALSAWFSLIVEQRKSLWRILIGLISYGLLLELLQSFTSYRFGDFADVVANSLGVITGLVFYFSPLRSILRKVDNWLARF
jgi:VanZ family protein